MSHTWPHFRLGLAGVVFGFVLSWVGFADFGAVQGMFTFADLRLLLTFVGAVVLSAVAFAALPRARRVAPRPFHPGSIPGGLLFGAGWALCGACPSIALVQLGEGRLCALATIAGIALGTWTYGQVHSRFFRWDPGTCDL